MKTFLPSSLERLFYKNISLNEEHMSTYCYGKHTKFSNDCIRWFIYNISKEVGEYNNLCYEFETDVELQVSERTCSFYFDISCLAF